MRQNINKIKEREEMGAKSPTREWSEDELGHRFVQLLVFDIHFDSVIGSHKTRKDRLHHLEKKNPESKCDAGILA